MKINPTIIFGQAIETARAYLDEEDLVYFYSKEEMSLYSITGARYNGSDLSVTSVDLVAFLLNALEAADHLTIIDLIDYPYRQIELSVNKIPANILSLLKDVVQYRLYLFNELEKLEGLARRRRFNLDTVTPFLVYDCISINHVGCKSIEAQLNKFYLKILNWWDAVFKQETT